MRSSAWALELPDIDRPETGFPDIAVVVAHGFGHVLDSILFPQPTITPSAALGKRIHHMIAVR